jgi:gas vesicle protein
VKSSPRSKTSSLVIGALIGLLLGAIAAIVVDARRPAAA